MPLLMKPRTRSRWVSEIIGPRRVAGSIGSPVVNVSATSLAFATNSSLRLSGTSMRVHAMQVWPPLR